MSDYKTTHLPPEEIDRLRFKAFATNNKQDIEGYYKAASLYFQERHERAINRHSDMEVLKALLKEARDEIREYVDAEYPEDARLKYPSYQRRFENDIELCYAIDKVLLEDP